MTNKQPPRNAWSDEPDPFCPQLTVYEPTREDAVDTGLYDVNGKKIFRRLAGNRIGFDLAKGPR